MLRLALIIWLCVSCAAAWADSPREQELRGRIADLEAQNLINQSRIEELGGGATSRESVNNLRSAIDVLEDKANRLERVAQTFARNDAELKALRDQVASGEPITLEDVGKGVAKKAAIAGVKKILERAALKTAEKAAGPAGWIGTALEFGGKYAISKLDAAKIEQMVREEHARMIDLLRLVSALRRERNAMAEKRAEVERLGREQTLNIEDVAKARAELDLLTGKATDQANLERNTDAEGDEQLRREALKDAARLCDPSTRKKAAGVRPTAPTGQPQAASELAIPEQHGDCRMVEGNWLLKWQKSGQQIPFEITYTGPSEPGPGVPASYALKPIRGWPVRCTAQGYELNCETGLPQPPTCPGAKWPPWQKRWDMTVPAEGLEISGVWEPTLIIVGPGTSCHVEPSPYKNEMAFTMTPLPKKEGDVSAK